MSRVTLIYNTIVFKIVSIIQYSHYPSSITDMFCLLMLNLFFDVQYFFAQNLNCRVVIKNYLPSETEKTLTQFT